MTFTLIKNTNKEGVFPLACQQQCKERAPFCALSPLHTPDTASVKNVIGFYKEEWTAFLKVQINWCW